MEKDFNRHFPREDIHKNGQEAHEKKLNIISHWEKENQNHTMMYQNHYNSYNKKKDNKKCWQECGEIGTSVPCWLEQNDVAAVEKSMTVPPKI